MLRVCADAASSFLHLRDGKKWDPRDSLLAPHADLRGESADKGLKALIETWRRSAQALGEAETAAALALQGGLLYQWENWDKALAAFRRVPSPRFDMFRDRLFEEWRGLVAERSVSSWDWWGEKRPDEHAWVRHLVDTAWAGDRQEVFLDKARRWLKEAEKDAESLKSRREGLARLSLDIDGGAWLKRQAPALARLLSGGRRPQDPLSASRRRWLRRLGASALVGELSAFWKRNTTRWVPDPAGFSGSRYERHADWLQALLQINPEAARKLLGRWAATHWRRRNLWQAVRGKGIPVPDLRKARQ